MDFYSFIDSEEIREHYRKNVVLEDWGKAHIIAVSNTTLEEKLSGLRMLDPKSKWKEDLMSLEYHPSVEDYIHFLEFGLKEIHNEKVNAVFVTHNINPKADTGDYFQISDPEIELDCYYKSFFSLMEDYKTFDLDERFEGDLIEVDMLDPTLSEDEYHELAPRVTFIMRIDSGVPQIMQIKYIHEDVLLSEGFDKEMSYNAFGFIGRIEYPINTGELVKIEIPGYSVPRYGVIYSENDGNGTPYSFFGTIYKGKAASSDISSFDAYLSEEISYINCIKKIKAEELPAEYSLLINVSKYIKKKIAEDPKNAECWFEIFSFESDREFIDVVPDC